MARTSIAMCNSEVTSWGREEEVGSGSCDDNTEDEEDEDEDEDDAADCSLTSTSVDNPTADTLAAAMMSCIVHLNKGNAFHSDEANVASVISSVILQPTGTFTRVIGLFRGGALRFPLLDELLSDSASEVGDDGDSPLSAAAAAGAATGDSTSGMVVRLKGAVKGGGPESTNDEDADEDEDKDDDESSVAVELELED